MKFFVNDYFKLLVTLKQYSVKVNEDFLIHLTQEELGKIFYCSRQTMSKMLNELDTQGYIKILGRNKIKITDKGLSALYFLGCKTPFE